MKKKLYITTNNVLEAIRHTPWVYLHRNISFVHRVIQNDTTTSNKSNK